MKYIFDIVNSFFEFIVPISNTLWEFPTNLEFYAQIPILGEFSIAIIFLLGIGVYFTLRLKFLQVRYFTRGIKILVNSKTKEIGVSPLSAFLLSSAMRVGPGNIMGVTGAIAIGGPGAMFWMWVSAFFGMATAFVESTLAQIFKEKKGNEYVGGVPFYARAILGGRVWIGTLIALISVLAFLSNIPGQTFHLFTSLGSVVSTVTGVQYERTSIVYFMIAFLLMITTPIIIFGGIRRVTKITNAIVPIMALTYCGMILIIIIINYQKIPEFFVSVFGGAFKPEAIFGGLFGIALIQGIKRGLMSNEAGQGTITTAAAVADSNHPCEQGFVQSIGVFLDTMVICTLSGFMVVMASRWLGPNWETLKGSNLSIYLDSIKYLVPGQTFDGLVQFITSISYALFAFTTLVGMISFSEISAMRITKSKKTVLVVRLIGVLLLVPFGCLTVLAGLELSNLWMISDLTNIMLVYINVPVIFMGFKYVNLATINYFKNSDIRFNSEEVIGIKTDSWN